MSDLFSKATLTEFFTYEVNNPRDDTRQLENQQLNIYTRFLVVSAENPVDNTRQLDNQSLTIHTFVDLQVNKPESSFTWTDEANVHYINVYPYFLPTVHNPIPDATRPLSNQELKVIYFADTQVNKPEGTWTTNPDNSTDSKQPLTFYDYALQITNNPEPDALRDLNAQELKVYDWALWTVDNPPWVRGNLKIPNYIKVIWEQHPVRFNMEIGSRLEAFHHLKLAAHADITDSFDALNLQFANEAEQLNMTPTIGVTWEQHKIREGLGLSDSWFATMQTKHRARLRIKQTFSALNIQYASIQQKVICRPRLSAGITWEEIPTPHMTITPTLKAASISTRTRERLWVTTYFGQFENNPWRTRGWITTSFSAEAKNPEYLYVTDRGRWRTWYETQVIDPPSRFSSTLKITTEYTTTATNPTTPDPTPTPDTGGGSAYEEEQRQDFVYIRSWLTATETTTYRDVLAVATWMEHTPHSRALLQEKLTLKFDVLETKGGHDELWAKVEIKDFLKISSKDLKNILEFVRISDFYRAEGGASEEEYTTYVINEDNETTRYEHWPFESYAAFKGVHFGCGPDGIYELTGDDDNGEPIAAMINFGKQSFGSSQMKRVPYVYASLASDGDLYMQVSYTDDNVYMYPARKVDEYNATVRFDLGRGIKANYLNFELYNENGSKFDLRNVWIYLTELSRRI